MRVFGPRSAWAGLHRFASNERGFLSIEFLIWVPMLLYLGVVMFVLSHYMAMASEVQQVANEVARGVVGRLDLAQTQSQMCSDMRSQVLPKVVRSMSLVSEARFAAFGTADCVRDSADFVTIVLVYDLNGTALNRMGRLVGFELTSLRRLSVVQL